MNRLRGHERGQILVLFCIALVELMGFLAIAVDVGLLWTARRHMQTAADAAAVAGAVALRSGGNVTNAGQGAAALNSFTNGQNNTTVTVNNPPLSGAYAGNSSYVEAIVDKPETTYFLRTLGYTTVHVRTRAVSGAINAAGCMYALDPIKSAAIGMTGSMKITLSCGIIDDSNSSSALSGTGSINLTATSIGVVGGSSFTGSTIVSPKPIANIAPVPDPLADLAAPTVYTCTEASSISGSYSKTGSITSLTLSPVVYSGGYSISGSIGTIKFNAGTYGNQINFTGSGGLLTFNPGQYQNGGGSGASITINGSTATTFSAGAYTFCGPVTIVGSNSVTLQPGLYYGGISITGSANVTFSPGTYVLAGGGLSVTGSSTLSGSGVTFYNTTGLGGYQPIDLTGSETANLSAPTSGPLEGILFFQDRSIASGSAGSTVTGSMSSTFDGALYFPTTALTYTGSSSSSGYTFVIADTITFTGSTTLGDNYSSLANGSPVKSSTLYE